VAKVINYLEYLQAHQLTDRNIKQILVMVDHLYPRIEALVDEEISNLTASKEVFSSMKNNDEVRSLFDVTLITSLSFILSQYLVSLATRPNNLSLTPDNIEMFATNLIHGMIKTFERKLKQDD
jgi:hypothetical protein